MENAFAPFQIHGVAKHSSVSNMNADTFRGFKVVLVFVVVVVLNMDN